MLWDAHGMSNLHIGEGIINSEHYMQALEEYLLPTRGCLFQDSSKTMQYTLSACSNAAWLCSPDLSPIDTCGSL